MRDERKDEREKRDERGPGAFRTKVEHAHSGHYSEGGLHSQPHTPQPTSSIRIDYKFREGERRGSHLARIMLCSILCTGAPNLCKAPQRLIKNLMAWLSGDMLSVLPYICMAREFFLNGFVSAPDRLSSQEPLPVESSSWVESDRYNPSKSVEPISSKYRMTVLLVGTTTKLFVSICQERTKRQKKVCKVQVPCGIFILHNKKRTCTKWDLNPREVSLTRT